MAKNQSVNTGKKLRGAVLIMVLTVMFMLIILLLATLTVVSTAQNRYYAKFEENQAYYTARSALDVFTNNIISDPNYIAQDASGNRAFNYTDYSGATPQNKTADMSQGLALELELYKIKAKNIYNGTDYSSKVWGNIPQNDVFADTAEKNNFTLDATPVDSITYTVEFPDMSGTNKAGRSANYGRFVDEDSSGKQVATIKVEVLERIYNMGGAGAAYTQNDLLNMGSPGYPAQADVEAAIAAGNRTKDYMLLKITSTVEFMGEIGTAVVYYETTEPDVIISGNAMTSFGGIQLNNMTILGGASADSDTEPKNMGKVYGGVYANGDYHVQGGGTALPLTKKEVLYIGDEFSWQNAASVSSYGVAASDPRTEYPLVYVLGTAGKVASSATTSTPGTNSSNFTWGGGDSGTATQAIDLVVHGISNIGNDIKINGNVYCIGDFDTRSSTSCKLYNGSAAFIKGDLYPDMLNNGSGKFYVDGDVYVPDSYIDNATGQVLTTGFNTVEIRLTGKFLRLNGDDFIKDAMNNSHTLTRPNSDLTVNATQWNWDDLELSATELAQEDEIEISLPKLSGTSLVKSTPETYNIPTYLSEYAVYLHRETDGSFSKNASGEYYPMTAAEYAGTSEADRLNGNYTVKNFDYTSVSGIKLIKREGNGVTNVDGTSSNTPTINCATTADYYLETASSGYDISQGYKDFKISGGGTVNIYLKPGYYKGQITVADDTTVNFYAEGGDYTWEMEVYNDSINGKIAAGTTVNFGKTPTPEAAPKINFYVGGDEANTNEFYTNQYTQMTAYVYAPYTKFIVNTAPNRNVKWNYNNGAATGTEKFLVIGSLVAGDIDMGSNYIGVAYIDPNANSYTPGKPMFNWAPQSYNRK